MTTKWKDFISIIENEAKIDGQEAIDQLKIFKDYYRNYVNKIEETCLIRSFFEEQQSLPINRRATLCMIYCPCSHCNPYSL